MKRLLSLLLILSLLLSVVSCADFFTTVLPSPTPTPTPPNNEQNVPNNQKPPSQSIPSQPTPPPVMLPDMGEMPDAVSATYRLITEGGLNEGAYTLYALYVTEDGARYCATSHGAYTVSDSGLYTLSTDTSDVLYGVFRDSVFYLTDETGESALPPKTRGGNGITETEITPTLGNRTEGYRDLANNENGSSMQAFYRALLEAAEAFRVSNETVTSENCSIAAINYAALSLQKEDAIAVWKIFTLENPAYYWLSTSVYTSSTTLYLCIDPSYASSAVRREMDAAVSRMIAEADAGIHVGMSELDVALYLHDFILDRIDYSYGGTGAPETAIWAHNVIGVATKRGGVCEAYAKSFLLLGTIFGLDVLTVSGYAGEPHAWNLMRIGDAWYGVDLTWDDTKEATHAYTHFGMSATALEEEHWADTPYETDAEYLYALPPVSETDIALVTLYKDGAKMGIYASIDDAFLQMTDAYGNYRIDLFNYAFEGEHQNAYPTARHTILAAATPKVKSITLTGGTYVLDGHTKETPLYFLNAAGFTLNADLSVENAALTSELPEIIALTLDGHTLTFTGKSGGCDLSLLGTAEGASSDTVSIRTEEEVFLSSYTRVKSIHAESGTLVLAGGAQIQDVTAPDVRIAPAVPESPFDYRIDSLSHSSVMNLIVSDDAVLYLGKISMAKLAMEFAFEDKASYPDVYFTEIPTAAVSILIDGNVDERTVATPVNLDRPIATFPTDMTMDTLDIAFVVWYSQGGVKVNRNPMFEIKNDGTLQTIDYTIVENSFVMSGTILLLYIGDEKSVTLPASTTEIYPMAFLGLDNLESVTLNEGVTTIQPSAFLRCPNLSYIYLPTSLSLFRSNFASSLAKTVTVRYGGTLAELRSLFSKNGITSVSASFTFVCTDGSI